MDYSGRDWSGGGVFNRFGLVDRVFVVIGRIDIIESQMFIRESWRRYISYDCVMGLIALAKEPTHWVASRIITRAPSPPPCCDMASYFF